MQIIGIDNHNNESVADFVWLDGFPDTPEMEEQLERICERLNKGLGDFAGTYYKVVDNSYTLWRGMKELV